MASLEDGQAAELEAAAFDWGMDALIEVHNAGGTRARDWLLKSPLIGVNNRNLKTFETSLDTTRKLARLTCRPTGRSSPKAGSSRPRTSPIWPQYGARCFLIGESLMRQDDVEMATRQLLAKPAGGLGMGAGL